MAHRTALVLEDLFSFYCQSGFFVWVRRTLERIKVERNGVKLFVAAYSQCFTMALIQFRQDRVKRPPSRIGCKRSLASAISHHRLALNRR